MKMYLVLVALMVVMACAFTGKTESKVAKAVSDRNAILSQL